MKFVDLTRHGYVLLDVTPEAVQAEWYYVSTLVERGGEETLGAALVTGSGVSHLVATDAATSPRDDAPAPAP
jgi:alkaline phosphatase D